MKEYTFTKEEEEFIKDVILLPRKKILEVSDLFITDDVYQSPQLKFNIQCDLRKLGHIDNLLLKLV